MSIDKTKLVEPPNTEENRETLAETILNDMSYQQMREEVKRHLLDSYRISRHTFSKAYWDYYEETYGHCPFKINSN